MSQFQEMIERCLRETGAPSAQEATAKQLYHSVSRAAMAELMARWKKTENQKRACYLSAEFLTGRLIYSNLMNLGLLEETTRYLEQNGISPAIFEQIEDDALGNGGLGRLAACFLDSAATQNIPLDGYGIRYRYGLFQQRFEDGFQKEYPDDWTRFGDPWSIRREEESVLVRFADQTVRAVPYDMPVIGYGGTCINTLRLWQSEPVDGFDLSQFNSQNYTEASEKRTLAEAISAVLYPNDDTREGKRLRLKQQYFFASASIQSILRDYRRAHGDDFSQLPQSFAIQLNDTHPVIAIPELLRILCGEYMVPFDEAFALARDTFAYTNHTIMAEALEKWPIELFSRLLPRVYQIVEEINRRFLERVRSQYPGNEDKVRKMAVIYDGQVRMANLAIVGGYSVNGVARLHTEILEKRELKDFYEMMPEKFSNKTNGITQRRFLLHGNPLLADWVTAHVGADWITDLSKISGLAVYADDEKAQAEFMNIKYQNKVRLAEYIREHNGVEVDPRSIFDVQVKRLHEYKRQLLNILHVMYLYNKIKEHPEMPFYPRTFIFGAKASAGYAKAKKIIKLINSVAEVINHDDSIKGKIKVVFIEDYRVSNAEWIFAAADVSEQISTASKEASGTGNMKFMLNGALTLGTMDGANVEIVEEVGEDNAFIFGLSADEVMNYEKNGGYDPMQYFNNDPDIRQVLMQLINGMYSHGDMNLFRDLYDSLLQSNQWEKADQYFILADFKSYAAAQERVEARYRDEKAWARSAMLNTAKSGKFSSDRTIQEYVDDIWHLDKITVK